MKKLLLFFVLIANVSIAQDTLSYDQFLELVTRFHPTAQRAALQGEMGESIVRFARGSFDPVVASKLKEKFFQDKHYYTLFNSEISVPTLTGVEIKAGYGDNGGLFLNPENYTPTQGTGYLGVKVPLGKGLFTDENRTGLKIAKQQQLQQEALAELTLNDLLLEASLTYWSWYENHYTAENLLEATQISANRFEFVKQGFLFGESAANDTLKAFVQWQDRYYNFFEANQRAVASFLTMNNFLWDDSLGLKQELIPYKLTISENDIQMLDSVSSLNETHPSLRYYEAKRLEAMANKRLKTEKLKPKLNLEYSLLSEGVVPQFDGFGSNQLWGFSFEFPLLVRSERAGLQLAKIKIKDTQLMYDLKERELSNKLSNQYRQTNMLKNQVAILNGSVSAYNKLVNAEQVKYRLGESTLFELNLWEQQMIDNQNKYLSLSSKYAISYAKIKWIKADWE